MGRDACVGERHAGRRSLLWGTQTSLPPHVRVSTCSMSKHTQHCPPPTHAQMPGPQACSPRVSQQATPTSHTSAAAPTHMDGCLLRSLLLLLLRLCVSIIQVAAGGAPGEAAPERARASACARRDGGPASGLRCESFWGVLNGERGSIRKRTCLCVHVCTGLHSCSGQGCVCASMPRHASNHACPSQRLLRESCSTACIQTPTACSHTFVGGMAP